MTHGATLTRPEEDVLHGTGSTAAVAVAPPLPAHPSIESHDDPDAADRAELRLQFTLAGACLGTLLFGWIFGGLGIIPHPVEHVFYAIAYVTGGWYPVRATIAALRARTFDVNLLMVLAAVGAAVVDQWREGATLMFLFSLSGALEHFAMGRSRHAIRALMKLSPEEALVLRDGVERVLPVSALVLGDRVIVRPGERIPADGVVVAGVSSVDQAPITGESVPVPKHVDDKVFAGTINGDGGLEIAVTRLAADSTLARIIRLVEEAQSEQTPTQRMTEWIGTRYTAVVLVVILLVILLPPLFFGAPWGATFYRAMTLMTVATPCALVLSTPAAILSAIAAAARRGVLFKGGGALEELGRIGAIAFDKTGTLTHGHPVVTEILPVPGVTNDRLLRLAAAAETRSEHPLSRAIVAAATEQALALPAVTGFRAVIGNGVEATVAGSPVAIGTAALVERAGATIPPEARREAETLQKGGKTVVHVAEGAAYLGMIGLADTIRATAPAVIAALRTLGVKHIVMLTGDNAHVAEAIAAELGITEVRAGLLPEDKLTVIRDLQRQYGSVAMAGDGINDAPALAAADVGIAMGGAGTDVALETADMALMADDLSALVDGVALSRRARTTVRQNVAIALGVIVVLVSVAAFGLIRLPVGVVGHEGSTIVVVMNGLRLLRARPAFLNGA